MHHQLKYYLCFHLPKSHCHNLRLTFQYSFTASTISFQQLYLPSSLFPFQFHYFQPHGEAHEKIRPRTHQMQHPGPPEPENITRRPPRELSPARVQDSAGPPGHRPAYSNRLYLDSHGCVYYISFNVQGIQRLQERGPDPHSDVFRSQRIHHDGDEVFE